MKSKNRILLYPLAIMALILMITYSCKQDDNNSTPLTVPILTTTAVSDITNSTASCGGIITSDGGSPVTARGVCWSTDTTPTINDSKTSDGTGIGSFTSKLTNLKTKLSPPPPDPPFPDPPPFLEGIEYFVRAYATNSVGTGYGNTILFKSGSSGIAAAPIDGGVGFLLFIGLFYGVRKYKKNKRS